MARREREGEGKREEVKVRGREGGREGGEEERERVSEKERVRERTISLLYLLEGNFVATLRASLSPCVTVWIITLRVCWKCVFVILGS